MSSPDAKLKAFWQARGTVDRADEWVALSGGNTNAVWRVGNRVVKQFHPGGETPLFGNDPVAERRALRALEGTNLAPKLLDANGDTVVYALVPGAGWRAQDGVQGVAKAMARLHAQPLPRGLPLIDLSQAALVRQVNALGGTLPDLPHGVPPARQVFLHGDATAANVLVNGGNVTFIDWQCPAIGDPASDLAVFLSPAMQFMSGNDPLCEGEVEDFLNAYGDRAVSERYRLLAPLYAARMRAYCVWRAARGDGGYDRAAMLEG